jgi:transcriptional regulator with XRE-family HTH domain
LAGIVTPVDVPEDQGASEDLPERHVTVNRLIALNMARFRKAAGMTQEQLGERLGWSNVAVSAAERSWDGKRLRQFDADTIIAIAMAIGIPVIALFLPPEDAGVAVRYTLELPGDTGAREMADLVSHVLLPANRDGSPAMREYARRLVAAGAISGMQLSIPLTSRLLADLGEFAAEMGADGPEVVGADIAARAWAKFEERQRETLILRTAEAEGLRLAIADLRSFEREYRQKLRAAIQDEMSVLTAQLARLSPEDGS